jgi:hypothetical protein
MTIALASCGSPIERRPRTGQVYRAEWFGYQLAIHPWLRRTLSYWAATQFLTIWALAAAPRAVAATMNTALNWTGITDSAGVSIGAYFLSTVDTLEAITNGGPDVNFYDPSTWIQWAVHSVTTGITHDTIATWIQAEASLYIFMLTAVLWLLRFSMSSTWLYWLATWFRPIFEVLHRFLTDHHFYAICLLLGVAVGAYHVLVRGHHGRGTGIILTAFAIMILGVYLLRDPIGELYSDNGLLNQARGLGFSTAQAALNNGPITTGGSATQLSRLTSQLVDALVRAPLQIWNFGTPVDDIGSCGPAWSHAILTGVRDAPAHAMQGCGAPQALGYARSIDGSIFALGLGYIVLGLLFAIFVSYVSYSYAMVIGAAFLNAILALFAAGPAMIHGAPRARARRRLKEFFRHACYVFVYVLYISFAAVIVLKTVTPGGYASQVGMNSPVAKLVLVSMVSAVATGIFWWLKKELGDQTRRDLTHTITNTYHYARDGFRRGRHTYDRGRALANNARDRFGNRGDDADEHGGSNESLTTQPVKGRPPGGNPTTRHPNSLWPPHQTPGHNRAPTNTPGPAPAATGSTGAEAAAAGTEVATAGAETGATILAPEVALPAAVAVAASHHHEQHREQAQQRPTPPNSGGTPNRQPGDDRRSADRAPQPLPVQSRTSTAHPAPPPARPQPQIPQHPNGSAASNQQPPPHPRDERQAPRAVPGRH